MTILSDRGFGRAEWAVIYQELKFRYLVQIKPDVTVSCSRYSRRAEEVSDLEGDGPSA